MADFLIITHATEHQARHSPANKRQPFEYTFFQSIGFSIYTIYSIRKLFSSLLQATSSSSYTKRKIISSASLIHGSSSVFKEFGSIDYAASCLYEKVYYVYNKLHISFHPTFSSLEIQVIHMFVRAGIKTL